MGKVNLKDKEFSVQRILLQLKQEATESIIKNHYGQNMKIQRRDNR